MREALSPELTGGTGGMAVKSISLRMQTKLLRFLVAAAGGALFLDVRELCRIGQPHPVQVHVRLISARNLPLGQLVTAGQMRPDFFYRLNVLHLDLPPLR